MSHSQPFLKNPDLLHPLTNENTLNSYAVVIPKTLYSAVEEHYFFIGSWTLQSAGSLREENTVETLCLFLLIFVEKSSWKVLNLCYFKCSNFLNNTWKNIWVTCFLVIITEKAAFANGKGFMYLVLRLNNSHTSCFQGYGPESSVNKTL